MDIVTRDLDFEDLVDGSARSSGDFRPSDDREST